jgi:hypothetical protein
MPESGLSATDAGLLGRRWHIIFVGGHLVIRRAASGQGESSKQEEMQERDSGQDDQQFSFHSQNLQFILRTIKDIIYEKPARLFPKRRHAGVRPHLWRIPVGK